MNKDSNMWYDTAGLPERLGNAFGSKNCMQFLFHNANDVVMSDHHSSFILSNAKSGLTG